MLKRFSCATPCRQVTLCANMALELERFDGKSVDIFFLTEFPGQYEANTHRFLEPASKFGGPFHNIIKTIEKHYGTSWSYAIGGVSHIKRVKNKEGKGVAIDQKSVAHCADQVLTQELEYTNPKVVVLLGEEAYRYVFNKLPPYGLLIEDRKFYQNVEICGEKRDVFFSLHPVWHIHQPDSCSIGALYEVIRRAVDYVLNGIHYNIPKKFKSELITDYDEVKAILNKMRKDPRIVAVDTEDNNLNRVYNNELLSIQLCNDGKTGYTIPINHYESPFKYNEKLQKLFKNFFTKQGSITGGYLFVNAKYDMHQLFRYCHAMEYNAPLLDCSFGEFSLDENWTRVNGFPQGKGFFSLFTMSYKRGFDYYAESNSKELRANLSHLPLDQWSQYGGADVVAPWHIFKTQMLQAQRVNYLEGFLKLNFIFFGHLVRSCTYVEHCGLSIDVPTLNFLYSNNGTFDKALKEVMDEFYKCESVQRVNDRLIKAANGTSSSGLFGKTRLFNPSKNLQRETLYFDEMGLEPVEDDEDDTGTTGKAFQKRYAESYKEVDLLQQFNALNKLKTGFINPVYAWINPKSPEKLEDFYIDERVRGNFTYLTVTGRLRCFKPNCYTGDTYINVNGRLTTFEEFAIKNSLNNGDDITYSIDTPTGVRNAYKFWKYENQPVLKFTLDTNHTLKCTYENDCYILSKDGIIQSIQAKNIKVGDYFLFCGGQSFPEEYIFNKKFIKKMKKINDHITWPEKMTPELAYILGSLCADGSKLSFGQYEGNRRIFDYFQYCWEKTFGYKNHHNEGWMTTANGNQTYFYQVYYQTQDMFKFFKYLGHDALNVRSHTMTIPSSIFKSNKECIIAFINAYVDSDDWFSTGYSRVSICSTSYECLKQISQLLLKFGIVGYLRKDVATSSEYKGKPCKKLSYLDISGIMFDKYMRKIGFGKKTVNEPVLSDMRNGGILCRIPHIIPNISKETEQLLLFRKSGANSLNIRRITDRFMDTLYKENLKIYRSFDFILKSGATPVRIKNIEEIGNETVYDVTIEKDNTQIPPLRAGNIIVNGLLEKQSQQRPSRGKYTKDILQMYSPKKGRAVVKLDYATFEVKGLGFMSSDANMIKSFNEMHELKEQYRQNPEVFFEQGKEIEEKGIIEKEKALKERIQQVKKLKKISPDDYQEEKEKILKEKKALQEERAKFDQLCEENPSKFSWDYLKFQTDFHRRSAALFNKCKIEEVSKEARQNAKGLVFGCQSKNSIISTAYGAYRINELATRPKIKKVQSINRIIKESDGAIYKSKQHVIRVLTRRNIIEMTSGHHIMVVTPDCKLEMKPCGLLKKGEKIIIQRGILGNHTPILMGKEISLTDAEAMGAFTGDGSGYVHKRGWELSYTAVSKSEVQRFRKFLYRWTGKKPVIEFIPSRPRIFPRDNKERNCNPVYKTRMCNKELYLALQEFGLLGKQDVRQIPSQILRAKPKYICAYLRGYFDADGSIKSFENRKQISLGSININLIYDTCYLLNLLGINSYVYYGSNHLKYKNSPFYELLISDTKSIKLFYKLIGFTTKHKKECLEEYIKYLNDNNINEISVKKYPFDYKSLNTEYQKRAGVSTFRSRPVYVNGVHILPLRHKPIENTIKHIDEYKESFYALGMKEQWKCLKLLSNPDITLSEVFEEAVDIGVHPVYDIINVDKYHKYTANGAVVSNSIYGRGVPSIAKELKISEETAQEYFNAFMNNMPEAGGWLAKQKEDGRKNLYVDSPLGRRRRVWGFLHGNKRFDGQMERFSMNSVIQGICSDCNLIATSLLISLIHKHGKAWYQTSAEDCWMLVNLIHDSCEMEVPVEDVFYALLTFEALYTNLLMYYIKKVFGFEMKVPIEVDFTVGSSYANTNDWNGSKIEAKQLQRWILEECGKRDNVDYMNLYKGAIKHPYFKEFEGIAEQVVEEWIIQKERTYPKIKTRKKK